MGIHVSLASFKKGFPSDMAVPQRLVDFAAWVKKVPRGALGWFDAIASEPLDVTYTDNEDATKALRKSLGIFLSLPDGSRLALWNHGGVKSPPAVVLLGSEGELRTVAPDLDTFLLAWAKGKSGVDDLDDDDDDGEIASMRPALAKWLADAGAKASKAKAPAFKAWFDKTVKENTSAKQRAKEDRAAEAALASADPVEVDLDSVREGLPPGLALPARLERFTEWLKTTRDGGLTDSELRVAGFRHSLVNDDRVDAELRKSLLFFMRVRDIVNDDEVKLALWFHDVKAPPAVVGRASDDDWRDVAPNLEAFLFAWSRGASGVDELDAGGVEKVRAELGAWFVRDGAKDVRSKEKVPSVAAWIEKVRKSVASAAAASAKAKGKSPPQKGGKPGKPPANMAARVPALLGKAKEDPAVVAFCADLGIDIEATTADDVLNRYFVTEHGYSLSFRVPKEGADKTRRFVGARFHQAKHRWWSYALGRDVAFQAFKGPLPRGIQLTWSREETIAALGKPTESEDDSLEWLDPETKVRLGVEFAGEWDKIPAGQMKCVWLAV